MTLLFVLIFLDLSSYPGCLPGLYFVQGSLFLAGRTGSYMAAVSKVIKHPITEANNRKIDKKKLPQLVDLKGKKLVGHRANFLCHLYHNSAAESQTPPKKCGY